MREFEDELVTSEHLTSEVQRPLPVPLLLLTLEQAAQCLGISSRMLWGLWNDGDIPRVKIGRLVRFRLNDLQRWVGGLQAE